MDYVTCEKLQAVGARDRAICCIIGQIDAKERRLAATRTLGLMEIDF